MKSEDLSTLSKEDLINRVQDLQMKGCIESNEISKYISYRDLLESTSDIIFVLDKNEHLVYLNSAWRIIFPSRGNEKFGQHYEHYIPIDKKDRARDVFTSVITEGTVFENEIMKTYDENGGVLYFSTSFSPVRTEGGEIIGLIGIMKNITQQYMTQKKLKENTRMLEAKIKEQITQAEELKNLRDLNEELIRDVPVGIFTMDPTGIMLMENPALMVIMGRNPGDSVVGVNLLEYSGFVEGGLAKLFEQSLSERRTIRVSNVNYRPIAGGSELIINVIMDPILDKVGNVEKVIVMVEDITEQAKITKRMNRAEKLSALGVLSAGVASELKNYINKMVMDLNFVENNVERDSPAAEYIDSLQTNVERIKNISEQLVSLSAVDEGDKEICELNKLVTSHPIEVFLKRLRNEGFEVDVLTADDEPTVRATQNQLQQILLQFLENAEEAMPDKGRITVSISTAVEGDMKYAFLTVEDTGLGIPEDNFKKIFQPFFTTKGKSATGLGLMIVSSIVENLGGCIGLKSRAGEGTSIRIALPVA
ncbi:MAG: PAS domain S-box protein [Spirochaetes bacterium]|nr:PAS domain S-box protein [Spirochaetota bacterium]